MSAADPAQSGQARSNLHRSNAFPNLHRALMPVLAWTTETALPFWGTVGVDRARGGFQERLDLSGQPVLNVPKRLMVQGRQLYVYSFAASLGWYGDGRALADRCIEYLTSNYLRADGRPGWIHSIRPEGGIANPMRDAYGHAFILLGMAWYFRLTQDPQILSLIDQTLAFLDEELASPHGGYRDAEPAANAIRRQNPHMHLIEAFLALYEATGFTEHRGRALRIFELFSTRFFQPTTGTLCEYLTDTLAPQPGPLGDIVEPGHHYEWIWLLQQLRRLTGQDVSAFTSALYAHADRHGWDHAGLIIDEVGRNGAALKTSRRIWPLCEAIKANVVEGERASGDFDNKAAHCMLRLSSQLLARPIAAGWTDHIDSCGAPLSDFIPASTLYHLFCAITEAARVTNET